VVAIISSTSGGGGAMSARGRPTDGGRVREPGTSSGGMGDGSTVNMTAVVEAKRIY
jgi:hypothetical protein